MALIHDQDPVEQFAAQRSDHPFTDRVRPRCSGWTGKDPDAVRGEDRIESSDKPAGFQKSARAADLGDRRARLVGHDRVPCRCVCSTLSWIHR